MIPDTCPYCGARRHVVLSGQIEWECGSFHFHAAGRDPYQSQTCARYVRTRISQLRGMQVRLWVHLMEMSGDRQRKHKARAKRVDDALLREIDRLRGGA